MTFMFKIGKRDTALMNRCIIYLEKRYNMKFKEIKSLEGINLGFGVIGVSLGQMMVVMESENSVLPQYICNFCGFDVDKEILNHEGIAYGCFLCDGRIYEQKNAESPMEPTQHRIKLMIN